MIVLLIFFFYLYEVFITLYGQQFEQFLLAGGLLQIK